MSEIFRTNHTFLNFIEKLHLDPLIGNQILIKEFQKGDKLFIQDQRATSVMFLIKGITKCYFEEENSKQYILEFLGTGEILGEIELLEKRSGLCTIEALTEVSAYVVQPEFFSKLIQTNLKLNHLLLQVLSSRIVHTASRASYQQLYTIQESLSKLLALEIKQDISISKTDMASYLGVTVRSLNRALKSISES